MFPSDSWKEDADAKFRSLLLATWELEQGVPPSERSSEKQIWSQISEKLWKAGFSRGAHVCAGHWFYNVRHLPEFRNTFPFQDKPLPNNMRNSDATTVVDTGMPHSVELGGVFESANSKPRPSWATPRPNPSQKNPLVMEFEAEKKKRDSNMGASQRRYSESSAGTLSMPPTGKRPTRKWTEEEFGKLEELVNAGIRANDLRPEGLKLKELKFFKKISEQMSVIGFERDATACLKRWQRAYPKGNELERETMMGENEIDEPEDPTVSKPEKPLEASDLALRWSEEEQESLASTIAESYLERKDEHGLVVMSSINWNMVESKHRAKGYTRTMSGLKGRWQKQKSQVGPSILPISADSDSDDDRPLSELRANRFKVVNDTVINSPSFNKGLPSAKVADKQIAASTLPDHPKKRNHASNLTTESDKEAAEHEQGKPKRVSRPKQAQANALSTSATAPLRSQIRDLEAKIATLEKNTATAPNAIGDYETELQKVDREIEKLRKWKEKLQSAKMKKLEFMKSGSESIKLLKEDKAKLEDAASVMEKMGL